MCLCSCQWQTVLITKSLCVTLTCSCHGLALYILALPNCGSSKSFTLPYDFNSHLDTFYEKKSYSPDLWSTGSLWKGSAFPCEFSELWLENLKTKDSRVAVPAFTATSSDWGSPPLPSPAFLVVLLSQPPFWLGWGWSPRKHPPDCWRCPALPETFLNYFSFFSQSGSTAHSLTGSFIFLTFF